MTSIILTSGITETSNKSFEKPIFQLLEVFKIDKGVASS